MLSQKSLLGWSASLSAALVLLPACGWVIDAEPEEEAPSVTVAHPDALRADAPPPPVETLPEGPNGIVVFSVDGLRADHFSCYGYYRRTSPHLDAVAGRALRFERALTPMASSRAAHASLFTGLAPLEHGVASPGDALTAPTLASVAARSGYSTAGFVGHAELGTGSGLEQGFATFDAPRGGERAAQETTDRALAWLETAPASPLLLWVHYREPMPPYAAPADLTAWPDQAPQEREHLERLGLPPSSAAILAAYDGEIRSVDQQIGRLLGALAERPDWRGTAVVVLGSHGAALGQRGIPEGGLWDEQLRVPLLMSGPGVSPAQQQELISLTDVFPTLLARLPDAPLEAFVGGASGVDVLAAGVPRRAVLSTLPGDGHAGEAYPCTLTHDGWKLMLSPDGQRRDQLFDLRADPQQQQDVSRQRPRQLQDMRQQAIEACLRRWTSEG
jgi:arylsulfatase A-like enzyme